MPFVPNPEGKWNCSEPCRHPEHEPPGMIVLPSGAHTWKCPGCGKTITFHVTRPLYSV